MILENFSNSRIRTYALVVCMLFIPCLMGYAQESRRTTIQASRITNVERDYYSVDGNELLKYGKLYYYGYPRVKGNQFLDMEKKNDKASIVFKDQFFDEIDLRYDVYNDLILVRETEHADINYLIIDAGHITSFILDGRKFIYHSDVDGALESGTYELAFESSRLKLLIKRKKRLIKDKGMYGQIRFENDDDYFLIGPHGPTTLKSIKDVLKGLGDNKEIMAFIKRNRYKFNKKEQEFAKSLVSVLNYYESLQKQ
ncbi:hypothetical protein QQ008_02950 [Fulvivirgaceae bacterium BMA10]|uniref:Uncharacterized protein n=1 Tax=Splendidivirga corallicola TaxID=3051826 RepID=A0ABT8KIP2_9BACT|nr:hypothetical protein [Fulvivirgaceae bacterium BMA10]